MTHLRRFKPIYHQRKMPPQAPARCCRPLPDRWQPPASPLVQRQAHALAGGILVVHSRHRHWHHKPGAVTPAASPPLARCRQYWRMKCRRCPWLLDITGTGPTITASGIFNPYLLVYPQPLSFGIPATPSNARGCTGAVITFCRRPAPQAARTIQKGARRFRPRLHPWGIRMRPSPQHHSLHGPCAGHAAW